MIDLFRTWLPQMIGYAQAVHGGTLEKAWADGDRSSSSTYYSGELYEQVFGDLDADNTMAEARHSLRQQPMLVDALDGFLCSLKRLDEWIEAHVDTETWGQGKTIPAAVPSIFHSPEWHDTHARAAALLSAAGQAGYSSKDFDPSA
jgi:hypothetical protein